MSDAAPATPAATATPAAPVNPPVLPEGVANPAAAPAPPVPPVPGTTGIEVTKVPEVVLPSDTLLAGKFKTPEALSQGYTELAKRLQLDGLVQTTFATPAEQEAAYKRLESKLGAPPAKPEPPAAPPAPPAVAPKSVSDLVARAGLNDIELGKQFAEHGALTDDQYAKLIGAAPGFLSKELIDQTIGNMYATAQKEQARHRANAIQVAGGEQQLQTLLNYAGGLPDAVQQDLNARLSDPAKYEGALLEIQQRFVQASRTGGSQALIGATGSGGNSLYATNAEMRAEMNDPRYGNDPNYTAAVRSKFQRSHRAGTIQPASMLD